jgi:lipid-A-disaccharide synthase
MASLCFVAGDPSGDAHAARLIEALKRRIQHLAINGLGGPAMQRAGMALLDDLTQTAAIGPFDAARHVGRFLRARARLAAHLAAHRPDLVILVDFGDFNLPVIAPLAKRQGLPVLYYISPQLWAWGRWRLRYVRRYVDRMVVFFPFEEAFYRREGIPVSWVGHPLVDQTRPVCSREEAMTRYGLNPWRRIVGLLPGSRRQEVARHLPLMVSAARRIAWRMPGAQFLLAKAPSVAAETLTASLRRAGVDLRIADGPLPDALQLMEAAIVTSGTATLECALAQVPMVVVYRASWPTYLAARAVIRVPHIAMVNLLADHPVVPEFLQHRAQPRRIADEVVDLLRDEERAARMRTALGEVTQRLGPPGAIERAADAVLDCLNP